MNPKLMMLERLMIARKRVRDVASAASTAAEAESARARGAQEAALGALDGLYESAAARLTGRGLAELELFALERTYGEAVLDEAKRRAEEQARAAEGARAVLLGKARELRTTEKARDRVRGELHARAAKREQRTSDDLGSRRRPR